MTSAVQETLIDPAAPRTVVGELIGVSYNAVMTDPTQLDPDFTRFDLIGDVHGCAPALQELLAALGYRYQQGSWRHRQRQALFTGDLVDRGPAVRDTLNLVHDMVEAGSAQVVLGNHEYNLLGWHTPAPADSGRDHLRAHSERNWRGLEDTLAEFQGHPHDLQDMLSWLGSLPLWLESEHVRVVHACWDQRLLEAFCEACSDRTLTPALARSACYSGSLARRFLDRILNGTELELPDARVIHGRDGLRRRRFRTAFWLRDARTLGDVAFQPDPLPEDLERLPLDARVRARLLSYPRTAPPVFFGHYWLSGRPRLQAANVCCLDYSRVLGGRLVAYRFDGEAQLDPARFVWVDAELAARSAG